MVGSCQACCQGPSKAQDWTCTHPAPLKPASLEQGHETQTCFWDWEGLTQAYSPQELLTQMCPWTVKGHLTPRQLLQNLPRALHLPQPLSPAQSGHTTAIPASQLGLDAHPALFCISQGLLQLHTGCFGCSALYPLSSRGKNVLW